MESVSNNPILPSALTLKQAAQSALDVQNACNLSGVVASLNRIIQETLWPLARLQNKGTDYVSSHPIVTMYLLKCAELNGCGSTLDESYEPAEAQCKEWAESEGPIQL